MPQYQLPPGSLAHSRHYLPVVEGSKETTTLVFDTWADVGSGSLLVHWPCQITEAETELLANLASSLGYLGRSESWVCAQLLEQEIEVQGACPCLDGEVRGKEWEQVALMAPLAPEAYDEWRRRRIESALASLGPADNATKPSKKYLEAQKKVAEPFPADLLACLTKDTAWWKRQGWSQPPGSQRVLYWREKNSLRVETVVPSRRSPARNVSMFLLALTTPSGNKSALPPAARALPQAELVHRSLVSRAGGGKTVHCPELTGQDMEGKPLQNSHEHAHTIPLDLDGDRRIDHVLIYASGGIREHAQRAIRSLRKTWMKGGVGELQVSVAGSGSLSLLRRLPASMIPQISSLLGPDQGATVWESLTPFVPPKTMDRRASRSIERQVQQELSNRGLPEAEVEILPDLTRDLRHYVIQRRTEGAPMRNKLGVGLRLTFKEPLSGPLCLGYASHYGLGLFGASDCV